MRGGRMVGLRKIRIADDYPEPQIARPEEVKIRVRYAAVNSDDYNSFCGELGMLYPDGGLFHEMSGEIVELGPLAMEQGFRVGDKVSRNVLKGCGSCPQCRRGRSNLCTERSNCGASSEYLVCGVNSVVRLPAHIDLKAGALYWLVATCTRCIERLRIEPGSSVLIMGGGASGQMLLQLVMKRMPSVVMISEPVAFKRELARRMGASVVIDPGSESLAEITLEVTNGLGVDVIIDAAGVCAALDNVTGLLARGGKLMLFSNYRIREQLHVNLMDMYWKEYTIYSSYGAGDATYTGMDAHTLQYFDLNSLIARVLPLEEMQKALELYGTGKYLRILLKI